MVGPARRDAEVAALLESLGIGDYAYVLVGRPSAALHVGAVIGQAWDLAAVSAGYSDFLADFDPYRTKRARAALDDRDAFVVRTRALHLFRGFPFLDPELPDDMMPDPRLRPRVVTAFHKLYADLHAPAARHFSGVPRYARLRSSLASSDAALPSRTISPVCST